MKKQTGLRGFLPLAALSAAVLILACGLSACAPAAEPASASAASGSSLLPSSEPAPSAPEGQTHLPSLQPTPTPLPPGVTPVPIPTPTPGAATLTGKLLPFGSNGGLVVSVEENGRESLYSFPTESVEIVGAEDGVFKPGMRVKITYSGEVLDIWPGRIVAPEKVEVLAQEDDNVGLYLAVLERILDEPEWGFEEAAEHRLTFDFSGLAELTDGERECLAQVCMGKYCSIVYQGSREELEERGLLNPKTGRPESGDFVTLSSVEGSDGVLTVKAEAAHQVGGEGLSVTASRDGDGNWVLSEEEERWIACG